jgi:hypothetical protein
VNRKKDDVSTCIWICQWAEKEVVKLVRSALADGIVNYVFEKGFEMHKTVVCGESVQPMQAR